VKEANFLTELKHSFGQMENTFWLKISDFPHFQGMKTRFDAAKPFDAVAVIDGVPIAIEAKMLKSFQAFGLRHLRECQIDGLERWERAGGKSYVFLNIRIKREKGRPGFNGLYIFHWREFRSLEKSIKKAELEKMDFIRGCRKLFDMEEIVRRI